MHVDVLDFFFVELGFEGAAARDDRKFLGLEVGTVLQHPARDVHHHVAHADNGDALAGGEILAGKRRKLVVKENEILRRIDALGIFAGKSKLLGALSAVGEDDGRGLEGAEVVDGELLLGADGDAAEVMDVGQRKDLGELLAQADLHLVFFGIDAVLGEPTGLDISIKNNDLEARLGDLLRREHPCWSGPNDKYRFHLERPPPT